MEFVQTLAGHCHFRTAVLARWQLSQAQHYPRDMWSKPEPKGCRGEQPSSVLRCSETTLNLVRTRSHDPDTVRYSTSTGAPVPKHRLGQSKLGPARPVLGVPCPSVATNCRGRAAVLSTMLQGTDPEFCPLIQLACGTSPKPARLYPNTVWGSRNWAQRDRCSAYRSIWSRPKKLPNQTLDLADARSLDRATVRH